MNTTSKIFFIGDNHGSFRHILRAVEKHAPDAIVFLGDIQSPRPLEVELASIIGKTEIRFIHGNHDTDSSEDYNNLFHSKLGHLNLHGRVDTVAGVRIAGLGGVFRGKVWWPWEPKILDSYHALEKHLARRQRLQGVTPQYMESMLRTHSSTIFPDVYDALSRRKADVLVTHEAPSCHPHGFDALDLLAQSLGVKTMFHGHHHDRLDYSASFDKLGFRAFGVGLCGISDQDGNVIVPGEQDDLRLHRSQLNDDGEPY